ncbi:MAG: hypothetical protein AVDCRST_MAG56-63 [uncultured Cytophagales bacterium]|uniref:Uncharacterized protein n=1 Tax=uncultured Cytophagales bacterium TaxID=158755 RepID=A0A6J4H4S7_9SPHI|nr:MAG: hypothetical protein AVDCRST_MAG56-63 [uncultured Cytophagales bacterium]
MLASLLHWLLRAGLADRSEELLVKCTGVAFFLLFAPAAIAPLLARHARNVDLARVAVSLALLVALSLPGWLALPPPLAVGLTWLIAGTGFVLAAIQWYSFFAATPFYRFCYLILLGLLFNLWVLSNTLRPALLEGVVAGITHIDLWFNISVAQMLKSYAIPSTGLDGTPWLYYHYGSHWYFALLSKLMGVAVRNVYEVGYPVIVVPVFFQAFLHFALYIRRVVLGSDAPGKPLRFSFWLLFLCIFLQVIKNLYSGVMLGYSFLESESFVLGLTFMFFFFSGCVLYWTNRGHYHPAWLPGLLLVILPVFVVILGFLKISVLYVMCSLAGYLFLRLGLYKKPLGWISLAVLVALSLVVYLEAVETLTFGGRHISAEGTWFPFYFYRETHRFEPLNFFLFFFQWTYLFILLTVVTHRLYNLPRWREAIRQKQTLPAECAVVIAVSGLLPSFFLFLTGPDAMYFSSIQVLVSAALVLAYLPAFRLPHYAGFNPGRPLYRVAATLASTGILLILYMNTRFSINDNLLTPNANVRKVILGDSTRRSFTISDAAWAAVTGLTGRQPPPHFAPWYSGAVQKALNADSVYRHLHRLSSLDTLPLSLKSKAMVYVDVMRQLPPYRTGCAETALITPALTGMAALDGILYKCPAGGYGFEYYGYKPEHYPGWDKQYSLAELLQRAGQKQRSSLFVYQNGKFVLYDVRNGSPQNTTFARR